MLREGWTHENTSGTCVKGCKYYGFCHCGCGDVRTLCNSYHSKGPQIVGEPYIYKSGHYPRTNFVGSWQVNGIEFSKVWPLLKDLKRTHTIMEISELVGVSHRTINTWFYRKPQLIKVAPENARKIYEAWATYNERKFADHLARAS